MCDRFVYKPETVSTMEDVDALVRGGAGSGVFVVCAGRQTGGVGTAGRGWESAAVGNLYCSIGLPLSRVAPGLLGAVPLAVGVAVHDALAGALGRAGALALKWPNDVLARASGRKVAGVLVRSSGGAYLNIGVGANVVAAPPDARMRPGGRLAGALADLAPPGAWAPPAPRALAEDVCAGLLRLLAPQPAPEPLALVCAEWTARADWDARVAKRSDPDTPLVPVALTRDGFLCVSNPSTGTTEVLVDSYLV